MIHYLRRLLYESTPAEFRSAYSVAESVERLCAATKRSTFAAIGEAAAVGKVSPDGVRLQRVPPMVRNSFKPFFVGRFESRDGVTLLTGRFGMSLFTKIFMTLWLAMVALFGVGFLVGSLSATARYPRPVVMGPFLMLIAGLGLVALGKWFARNDVAWLTGVIGRALDVAGVAAEPRQETLEVAGVPMVLKGVALFLAASGVIAALTEFIEPKLGDQQRVALQWGHWNLVYAVSAFVLAAGVVGRILTARHFDHHFAAGDARGYTNRAATVHAGGIRCFCGYRCRGLGALVVCAAEAFLRDSANESLGATWSSFA